MTGETAASAAPPGDSDADVIGDVESALCVALAPLGLFADAVAMGLPLDKAVDPGLLLSGAEAAAGRAGAARGQASAALLGAVAPGAAAGVAAVLPGLPYAVALLRAVLAMRTLPAAEAAAPSPHPQQQ